MYTEMNTRPTEGEFHTTSVEGVYFNPIYTEDDEYSEISHPHLKDAHYHSDIEDEPGKQVERPQSGLYTSNANMN